MYSEGRNDSRRNEVTGRDVAERKTEQCKGIDNR